MTLVVQLLWGALFTLPGGFDPTAARVSVLVLAAVEALAVLALARAAGAREPAAATAGLALACARVEPWR
jgi:hypothetical protein